MGENTQAPTSPACLITVRGCEALSLSLLSLSINQSTLMLRSKRLLKQTKGKGPHLPAHAARTHYW